MSIDQEIVNYYERNSEDTRLDGLSLEKIRTQELILRHIGNPNSTILDVGGGTGVYSFWLSEQGHVVHLVDASPKHIDQAKANSKKKEIRLASMCVGDARKLDFENNSFDVVLMLGPLYHLTKRSDRIIALHEAKRVLKPDGILIAVAISRYASMMDGFHSNLIQDPEFVLIMNRDLRDGQHRSVEGKRYFTTSFLHLPDELETEMKEAGFNLESTFAIESFADYISDLSIKLELKESRELLLSTIRKIE